MIKKTDKCRHFNGLANTQCQAGIDYESVRTKGCKFPCFNQDGVCESFEPYTQEEIEADERKTQRLVDRLKRGVSSCCEAPLDESQVITEGRHKGHGPRFCSKCGKLDFMV